MVDSGAHRLLCVSYGFRQMCPASHYCVSITGSFTAGSTRSHLPALATTVFSASRSACSRKSHICSLFRLASFFEDDELKLSDLACFQDYTHCHRPLSLFHVPNPPGSLNKLDKTVEGSTSPEQHPSTSKPCWPSYPHIFLILPSPMVN